MAQGYSIFSQAQGPVVPVSLYADAATAGINAGNALPTPLTAGITGAIKGYQTGLQIQATQQENTIRQNTIEQIPTANRIQNAQAATQEAYAKITENKALVDAATQANEIDQVNSDLEQKAAKAKQDLDIINLKNQFQKEMASSDPQTQAQVVLGGKYAGLFASDLNLQKSAYYSVAQNPNNGLDTATRSQLLNDGDRAAVTDADAKRRQKASFDYEDAASKLSKNSVVTNGKQLVKQPSTQLFLNNLEEAPSNVQLAPDGKTILIDDKGRPLLSAPGPQDRTDAGKVGKNYMYVDPVSKKKTLVARGVLDSDDFYKTYGDYTTNRDIISGASLQSELDTVDRRYNPPQPKGQGTTQSAPIGDLSKVNTSTSGTPQPEALYLQQAKTVTGLAGAEFVKATPSLTELNQIIQRESTDPAYRGSTAALTQKLATRETLARSIAESQFNNNPAIKARYREEFVNKYNKEVSIFGQKYLDYGIPLSKLAPFEVSSPLDYYYSQNFSMIQSQVSDLEASYIATANKQTTAERNKSTETAEYLSTLQAR